MIVNVLGAGTTDRAGVLRRDPDWVARQMAAPTARLVPVWRQRNFLAGSRRAPQPVTLDATNSLLKGLAEEPPIFLGLQDGAPHFAVDWSHIDDPVDHPLLADLGTFQDLRGIAQFMDPAEAALMAYARGMIYWDSRHRFCGVCGSPTTLEEAGHKRRCTNPDCRAEHFPRTDPAVITLVHDGERCLLGRSPRFPTAVYSTLAGFVEPGESLEACVAREIEEEVGVTVSDVRYHSSQPWPFPSSVMIGFFARAESAEITLDPDELVDARWFTRAQLEIAVENDELRLPGEMSIARRLVDDWRNGAF